MNDRPPPDERVRAGVAALLDSWLAERLAGNDAVVAVESDPGPPARRFARLNGESKDVYSVWFTVRQRTLHVETFVIPAPEENADAFYAQLLRRNRSLYGLSFAIGEEEAIFLQAEVPLASVTAERLDELLGSIYETIERAFVPALSLGFASRFA